MTTSTSLLDLLLNLLRDPSALAAYQDDPEAYLSSCGDFSPADVHDALVLIQDNQDADLDRDHSTGGNHIQVPPLPAVQPGETDHEAAVRYINNYVTNNHIDDRDTIVDNSVNQQIDTDGGDFDQDIDIDSAVASGDGAVAAGDDIENSTLTTGDDNILGDGNIRGDDNIVGDHNEVLDGHGNTASFGDGDASSASFDDVEVSQGGALATGGDAGGDYDVHGSFNPSESTTTVTTSYDDSLNSDDDLTLGSFNESSSESISDSHDSTHNDVLSHNSVDVDS
jgi:hypothetical protein